MKYLRELFLSVLEGHSPTTLLSDLSPQEKGHRGEALLRILTLCGIHPTDSSSSVIPYISDPSKRRLERLSGLTERLEILQYGCINAGGGNKIDVCWADGPDICVCSSKIGKIQVKSVAHLEIPQMLTEFTESGGYTDNGLSVNRANVRPYVLVECTEDVLNVAKRSKASNKVSKDNLNPLDIKDLERMCSVLRERLRFCESKDPETVLSVLLEDTKLYLRTRFHQKLLLLKIRRAIQSNNTIILLGALPRSGKTYIGADLAKDYKKILVITTRPGETRSQWNKVFNIHRNFSNYHVSDLTSATLSEIVDINRSTQSQVAIASIQFFKMEERTALLGLNWDLVLLDEIHEGGTTVLSDTMLDTYIGKKPIRIMMTATYKKPMEYYSILPECSAFWDLEDVRLMRRWGDHDVLTRLYEKYGMEDVEQARKDSYRSGETDESIRTCYCNAPSLIFMTTTMQQQQYKELSLATLAADNPYGFSMRSLFMMTKDGNAFQNPGAVDTFLALISGSNKLKDYTSGDMSIVARILRYWKTVHHRECDEFMTQIWFLPYGVGQLLSHVKSALITRIEANPILKMYATFSVESGMTDISKSVSAAVIDAKAQGKRGLILLTGNVGSLGVSLPEVDVGFMLHDKESADMNYQQALRVLTEALNKRCGIVVDFNVWRVLKTETTYAVSRCGQRDASSYDRIRWCLSHLIPVDIDLWQCKESPSMCSETTILDELVKQYRLMLEQTTTTLTVLAKKSVNIGDDQKVLDKIVKYLKTVSEKTKLEANPDQEALSSGIETREEGNTQDASTHESSNEEDDIGQKANLNDVLSRLIPDIAILSGYSDDLFNAMDIIYNDKTYREAMNEFLVHLYSSHTELDPFAVLCRLVKKHYGKLTDAKEIFEVISICMRGILDNPQELIKVLGQHLKPKEFEKKQNGEVFTPPELIRQIFDEWERLDPTIWSNPANKFLDPCNGIGNFPSIAFHKLMEGLKSAIPDEAARKKHILEDMLYMCELNKKNVALAKKLFNPKGLYNLHIHQGSFLDFDPKETWGIDKFHIFQNPPYNSPGVSASGNTIWQDFVKKCISVLHPESYLVSIHPNGWRKPNTPKGKFNGLFQTMTHDAQILHLDIHGLKDGHATFKCGTRYDWYILKKTPCVSNTTVVDEVGVRHSMNLREMQWLPNYKIKEVQSLLAKTSDTKCPILYDRTAYGADKKDRMSTTQDDVFQYPCIHSTPQKGVRYMYSKSNDRGHFNIPKVIFGEAGINIPILDLDGRYGMTHGAMAIRIRDKTDGDQLVSYLQSKEFQDILDACMFSSYRIDWNLFKDFRDGFWRTLPEPEPVNTISMETPTQSEERSTLELPEGTCPYCKKVVVHRKVCKKFPKA